MNKMQWKIGAASLLPAVATMLFVQACGGSDDAVAQATPDAAEGTWEAVVTQRDCVTSATIATFRSSQVLHRGGTMTETNGSNPATRGPGFGNWSRNADGTYTLKFRFYRYNADGSLAGSNVVTSTRTISADGNGYTSNNQSQVRDVAGNVIATACVGDVGTRFN